MENNIAPSYLMDLIDKIKERIWEKYKSYKKAYSYVKKFQEEYWNGNFLNGVSFDIELNSDGKINLEDTLHNIKDGDTLIKMAIDLEIETPDFIPAFPTFKNIIKENKNLKHIFDVAFKNLEEDPSLSIANSNSALESLLKGILKKHSDSYKESDTLKELTEKVLKLFGQYPNSGQDQDIRNIGSGLIKVTSSIESLRSNKTTSHGKTEEDYFIKDSLYSYFIINTIATVGLYIDSFYKRKFKEYIKKEKDEIDYSDIPF